MRVFVAESERYRGKPAYASIVDALRSEGFSGAIVLKAIEGFGTHRHLRSARVVDVSPALPIVVEVVEDQAKIEAFLPTLREMLHEGLVTLERLRLIQVTRD
jgi:PII-like signaling protein